jgi:hypothetical protein
MFRVDCVSREIHIYTLLIINTLAKTAQDTSSETNWFLMKLAILVALLLEGSTFDNDYSFIIKRIWALREEIFEWCSILQGLRERERERERRVGIPSSWWCSPWSKLHRNKWANIRWTLCALSWKGTVGRKQSREALSSTRDSDSQGEQESGHQQVLHAVAWALSTAAERWGPGLPATKRWTAVRGESTATCLLPVHKGHLPNFNMLQKIDKILLLDDTIP